MVRYTIVLSKSAEKTLDKFSDNIANPLIKAISDLETNPKPIGYKKLKGREGFRIRIGNYRVIYHVFESELIIDVITIGHRKDVYK